MIIFKTKDGEYIYTKDCGESFMSFKPPKVIVHLELSETKEDWILGGEKVNCKEK